MQTTDKLKANRNATTIRNLPKNSGEAYDMETCYFSYN